jgi:hypothetical protein
MEGKEFLDKLSDFEPLKKPCAPWNSRLQYSITPTLHEAQIKILSIFFFKIAHNTRNLHKILISLRPTNFI